MSGHTDAMLAVPPWIDTHFRSGTQAPVYEGMPRAQACEAARAAGSIELRIIELSAGGSISDDFRMDRLNLVTRDGSVVRAVFG